jgi:hypothetical protein
MTTEQSKTEFSKWRAAVEAFADAICWMLPPEEKRKGGEMRQALEKSLDRMAGNGADRMAEVKIAHPIAFALSQSAEAKGLADAAAERADAERKVESARTGTGMRITAPAPRPVPPSCRAVAGPKEMATGLRG